MQMVRQQNSTSYPIPIGLWDSAGAPVVGVTPTLTIEKNGGSAASPSGSVGASNANGTAYWTGNATDRNTLGVLRINVSGAGAESYALTYVIEKADTIGVNFTGSADAGLQNGVPLLDADQAVKAKDQMVLRTGTAQGGGATTITLDAGAPASDDLYAGDWILITAGTAAGQIAYITAYDGTTKQASVKSAQGSGTRRMPHRNSQ